MTVGKIELVMVHGGRLAGSGPEQNIRRYSAHNVLTCQETCTEEGSFFQAEYISSM